MRRFTASLCLVAALTGCKTTTAHHNPPKPPATTTIRSAPKHEPDLKAWIAGLRRADVAKWNAAVHAANLERWVRAVAYNAAVSAHHVRWHRTHTTYVSAGGSLPPAYVCMRESRCTYGAYNPTGCGGHGCYGKWQFSGAWAGKLGLPADIGNATPAQQDEAARRLWANGAGCSNWNAC